MVDRADRRIPDNKTNQWLQAERSVRLVALWIRAVAPKDLKGGEEANPYWEPYYAVSYTHLRAHETSAHL
eukprot:10251958-Alexandrium_andersonii.AAC.1